MGQVITISSSGGGLDKAQARLKKLSRGDVILSVLNRYAQEGVSALSRNTPVESGETANSWGYKIVHENGFYAIYWTNHHVHEGVHIALILQYGHGTGTGGWVSGRDYINPAIRPIFELIKAKVIEEVRKA